jgi:hypothetical protein
LRSAGDGRLAKVLTTGAERARSVAPRSTRKALGVTLCRQQYDRRRSSREGYCPYGRIDHVRRCGCTTTLVRAPRVSFPADAWRVSPISRPHLPGVPSPVKDCRRLAPWLDALGHHAVRRALVPRRRTHHRGFSDAGTVASSVRLLAASCVLRRGRASFCRMMSPTGIAPEGELPPALEGPDLVTAIREYGCDREHLLIKNQTAFTVGSSPRATWSSRASTSPAFTACSNGAGTACACTIRPAGTVSSFKVAER